MKKIKLGLIAASRSFFDKGLAAQMRAQILAVQSECLQWVCPGENETANGCVESLAEAEVCAELFAREKVDGVLVAAVNFGSEQGVAWTLKKAGLDVPVLLYACQEEASLAPGSKRRDSFCGLISIADVLRQTGVKYTVATTPVGYPTDATFLRDVQDFMGVCRVVGGVRQARYGQIGARPDGFWTCRYDERSLQRLGPTTVTLDLSEAVAGVGRFPDGDARVARALDEMGACVSSGKTPPSALLKMAKLEVFIGDWVRENRIDALGIQCWTSIEQNLGICPCFVMSRFSDRGIPIACEADILGTLSMHALHLASGNAPALADWNNLHHSDHDLVNLWHCGVYPVSMAERKPCLAPHSILPVAGAAPEENCHGVLNLEVKAMPATLTRVAQSEGGGWSALIVNGDFEKQAAGTVGSYGWCRIQGLIPLYRDVILRHYPHHVAFTEGRVESVLREAFGNYLGMTLHGEKK